jgi:triosephosphate isomerase (TIM)
MNLRKKIVAGNWKMNKTLQEGLILANEIKQGDLAQGVEVVLAVPAVMLSAVGSLIEDKAHLHLSAQNCHHEVSGAFTGETSADMIKSVGATHCLVGHSERRDYFKENNAQLSKKVDLLLARGITPIFCCGESLPIRERGNHERHVAKQIKESLFHLSHEQIQKIVVAYEPIWAIGTGLTASPEQAQEMHLAIRQVFQKRYGTGISDGLSILYGGSCNASNARSIFSQPDVDGGLIGGASLKSADFLTIIRSF